MFVVSSSVYLENWIDKICTLSPFEDFWMWDLSDCVFSTFSALNLINLSILTDTCIVRVSGMAPTSSHGKNKSWYSPPQKKKKEQKKKEKIQQQQKHNKTVRFGALDCSMILWTSMVVYALFTFYSHHCGKWNWNFNNTRQTIYFKLR